MKKHLSTILIVIIFLIGLSLLLYPTVSDYYNQIHQSRAIATYVEQTDSLTEEEYERIINDANKYNENLLKSYSTAVDLQEYDELLNFSSNGVMGYIEIPKINLKLPIYHGTDESVLQVAVGHMEGSSLPIGGENTHTILLGHRGLPSAKLFTNLDKMTIGDNFYIFYLNQKIAYKVDNIEVVLPEELEKLKIETGKQYVTLVTCTPYGVNTHRLLVRGHQIDLTEIDVLKEKNIKDTSLSVILMIAIFFIVISFLIFFLKKRNKSKR